jgi:hypothetical protein
MQTQTVYIIKFCQITIFLIFSSSLFNKFRDLTSFENTIIDLQLVPHQATRLVTYLVTFAEFTVIFLLLLSNTWSSYGLILAFVLLVAFTLALATALYRGIDTSCNCFNKNDRSLISISDLVRNCLLISVTGIPLILTTAPVSISYSLPLAESLVIFIVSTAFVCFITNIKYVTSIFID